jgi:hypothetical protein
MFQFFVDAGLVLIGAQMVGMVTMVIGAVADAARSKSTPVQE